MGEDEIHEIKDKVNLIENKMGTMEVTMAKLDQVIEIVIVELRNRIKSLETKSDSKAPEVDAKIATATKRLYWVLGGITTMFIGAVVYFNNANNQVYATMNSSHTRIYERIAENNKPTVENTTNIKVILNTLNKIDTKLDNLQHPRRNNQ